MIRSTTYDTSYHMYLLESTQYTAMHLHAYSQPGPVDTAIQVLPRDTPLGRDCEAGQQSSETCIDLQ